MKKGLTFAIAGLTLFVFVSACQTSSDSQSKTETKTEAKTQTATETPKDTTKSEAKTVAEKKTVAEVYKLVKLSITYPDGMVIQSRTFALDKSGLVQAEEVRGLQNSLTQKKSYTYGKDSIEISTVNNAQEFISKSRQTLKEGRLVKEIQLNAKDEELSTEEFVFDDKGTKTGRILTSRTGGQSKTEYFYENGLLKKTVLKDSTGKPILSTKKIYDSSKRLITEEEYNSSDVLTSKVAYTYDNGLLIKKESQNDKGITQNFYTYEYDSLGNLSQIKYYNRQGKLSEVTIQEWKSLTELAK